MCEGDFVAEDADAAVAVPHGRDADFLIHMIVVFVCFVGRVPGGGTGCVGPVCWKCGLPLRELGFDAEGGVDDRGGGGDEAVFYGCAEVGEAGDDVCEAVGGQLGGGFVMGGDDAPFCYWLGDVAFALEARYELDGECYSFPLFEGTRREGSLVTIWERQSMNSFRPILVWSCSGPRNLSSAVAPSMCFAHASTFRALLQVII